MANQIGALKAELDARVYKAVCPAFTKVANTCNEYADILSKNGIGERKLARPYALAWASERYGVPIIKGERGWMVKKDSAADTAVKRVLEAAFPSDPWAKLNAARPAVRVPAGTVEALLKVLGGLDKKVAREAVKRAIAKLD